MNIHNNAVLNNMFVIVVLAITLCTNVHAFADDPLPPVFHGLKGIDLGNGPIRVTEGDTLFLIPIVTDPNPDGSGLPLTFEMIFVPSEMFGLFYQVNEDMTLGEQILGGGLTEITHPQGAIAFVPHSPSTSFPVANHTRVTNAYGLSTEWFLTIVIDRINHPPTAVSKTTTYLSTSPFCPSQLTYNDVYGDPLTIHFVTLPQHGQLYYEEIHPDKLITPGVTLQSPTIHLYYVNPNVGPDPEIEPGIYPGIDSFSYYVTDGEFDSNIAVHTIDLRQVEHPADGSLLPTRIEAVQNEAYVEFPLIVVPTTYNNPELFVVMITEVPERGRVQFHIPGSPLWLTINTPIPSPGVMLPVPVIDDQGNATFWLRYLPNGEGPTLPDDPSMRMRFSVSGPEWSFNHTTGMTILPINCSEGFVPNGCCHAGCYSTACDDNSCEDFCDPLDGASLYLLGDQQHVELGEFSEFNQVFNHGTVEMWFRTDRTDSTMSLLHLQSGLWTVKAQLNCAGNAYAPGYVTLQRKWAGSVTRNRTSIYALPEIFDHHWHHFAWRVDAQSDLMELYIDGVLRQPEMVDNAAASPTVGSLKGTLLLGAANVQGERNDYFIGQLDEVRFWSVPRTPEEILADLNSVVDPATPDLHSYWRLDEGAGEVAANLGGSGPAEAAVLNGSWWAQTVPCDVPPPACPADITGSGSVDVDDLLAVVGAWGSCPPPGDKCPADIVKDGAVNVDDLLAVISAWGPCP